MSGRIVVGVDRSDEAAAALRWACDEARTRNATLEVVHAWTPPSPVAYPHSARANRETPAVQVARERLSSIVRETLGSHPAVRVVETLVYGDPASALVADAELADLLVVGSGRKSPVRALFLGSVSQACTERSLCPVAVVGEST